ncbi:MAG TPA: hypothetical protein VF581_10850 [Flavobacterium sp.]
MKKLLILFFVAFSACANQQKEFSLIGRWLQVEEHGSDGAREFVNKVSDGDYLTFEEGNTVTDKRGHKGSYELNGDSLHIAILQN